MKEGSDRKKTGNAVFLRPADPVTRNPGQANIRAGLDYPFRVGGDEFVLLLTHCEEATAESILARLDCEFSKHTEIASLAHGSVSFIGGSNDEVELVLKEADVRMYAHKNKIKALMDTKG